jgi:diguanylate cyclase (GGDEF)-like protein
MLMDHLYQALVIGTGSIKQGALLFIGLDNFKVINETKGHGVGDLLLLKVSDRLKACVDKGDVIVRLGGDEFVVVLKNLGKEVEQAEVQARMLAEKILDATSQPYNLQGHEYHTTASIGIGLFQEHEMSVDELLKRADTAMYQAKQSGRNALRFFDPTMQAVLEERMALESDLRNALQRQQFRPYYQMQVDHAGQVIGAEVLLRWIHPLHGLVSPVKFIPLAEENGLILPIGQWVLETVCHQIKAWETNPITGDLQLAVNVSAGQFHQPDFVAQVSELLKQTAIIPSRLKLELTESMVLDDITDTIAKMHELKQLGVRFSMDDFGTGYSSLAYLTQLPLDQLKIDQSFVRNIGTKSTDAVIVQTIVGMANNLGMEVIAEGVETQEQRDFLAKVGCLFYQGYLFGKPVPLEEFEKQLGRQ